LDRRAAGTSSFAFPRKTERFSTWQQILSIIDAPKKVHR